MALYSILIFAVLVNFFQILQINTLKLYFILLKMYVRIQSVFLGRAYTFWAHGHNFCHTYTSNTIFETGPFGLQVYDLKQGNLMEWMCVRNT